MQTIVYLFACLGVIETGALLLAIVFLALESHRMNRDR